MPTKLKRNNNIVILAKSFNPSVFNQYWLIKNEILSEGDFDNSSIFTKDIAQISTESFNLFILPDQLALTFKAENEIFVIENILEKCIRLLPHIPFTAIGINFIYYIPKVINGKNSSRRLFFNSTNYLDKEFDVDDANFGLYLSKNYLNSRLKLDIKTSLIGDNNAVDTEEKIAYSFNFHKDLKDNTLEDILAMLKNWNNFSEYSEQLVSNFYKINDLSYE